MLCLLLFAACGDDKSVDDPTPDPDPSQPTDPDDGGEDQKPTLVTAEMNPSLWVAVDALGRTIDPVQYKSKTERGDKTVGIFYFIWMGSHGYDQAANWGELRPPSSTDVNSPYDIQKLLDEDMVNPAFGPEHAFHHWGEPYLGYYVANDEWVIRKHAQMLTDAGVDVLFFDVTNSFTYLDVVETICEVYTEMREEGNDTPQFAFVTNSNAGETALEAFENNDFTGKTVSGTSQIRQGSSEWGMIGDFIEGKVMNLVYRPMDYIPIIADVNLSGLGTIGVELINITTDGDITGMGNNDGLFINSAHCGSLKFTDCVNNANLYGSSYCGIFVGGYAESTVTNLEFVNCINNGNLVSKYAG